MARIINASKSKVSLNHILTFRAHQYTDCVFQGLYQRHLKRHQHKLDQWVAVQDSSYYLDEADKKYKDETHFEAEKQEQIQSILKNLEKMGVEITPDTYVTIVPYEKAMEMEKDPNILVFRMNTHLLSDPSPASVSGSKAKKNKKKPSKK